MILRTREKAAVQYYKDFLGWDIEKQHHELITRPAGFWEDIGRRKALETFHEAAERVPAYKKFLEKNQINHREIKTFEDFQAVPPVSKENYLKTYPMHELCWDGDLNKMNVISVSSGTSGQPFFWPRDIWQEREVDHYYELTYKYVFGADKKRSLVIIAFAMGMYIAGPFTFASTLRIAQKGYPISLATPSNDIGAVLRLVQNLAPEYEQVIIGGYPPLVRDILDSGSREGIDWKAVNTKLFFGGESFSEKWRDYIHNQISDGSILNTAVNMYGTADASLLGIETPMSVAFRRAVSGNKEDQKEFFGSERLPSLLTYNPLLNYFEVSDNRNLLFTTSSGVPLIRYKIGDVGGVIGHDEAYRYLNGQPGSEDGWNLPMVYLFGRDDFTVVLYGANVYPENIKEALDDPRINHLVSGKFIIKKDDRKDLSPYLDLKIEMAQGISPERSMVSLIKKAIVETLRANNSEYNFIYNTIKKKAEPRIKLEGYKSKHFQFNIKHSWVNKF